MRTVYRDMHVVRRYSVTPVLVFWIRTGLSPSIIDPIRSSPVGQAWTGRIDGNMILFCKSVYEGCVFAKCASTVPVEIRGQVVLLD
jgi:hypothetical protein